MHYSDAFDSFVYRPLLARILGDVRQAILLEEILGWQHTHRTTAEIAIPLDRLRKLTGFNEQDLRIARSRLKRSGILIERIAPLEHQTYFSLDSAALDRLAQSELEQKS